MRDIRPMKLDGGIDTYRFDERFAGDLPKGRLVFFLDQNGYDIELESARKVFEADQILEVKEIWVGRSSAEVEFANFEGRWNTVMFADLNKENTTKEPEKLANSDVQDYLAEGLYLIVDSSPETTAHRRGNLLTFPFELQVGRPATWVYVNCAQNETEDIGGKSCKTSYIKKIELAQLGNKSSSITIETENSVYEFMREM
jgi:hypothetical protein